MNTLVMQLIYNNVNLGQAIMVTQNYMHFFIGLTWGERTRETAAEAGMRRGAQRWVA